jgi:hypothetical protein
MIPCVRENRELVYRRRNRAAILRFSLAKETSNNYDRLAWGYKGDVTGNAPGRPRLPVFRNRAFDDLLSLTDQFLARDALIGDGKDKRMAGQEEAVGLQRHDAPIGGADLLVFGHCHRRGCSWHAVTAMRHMPLGVMKLKGSSQDLMARRVPVRILSYVQRDLRSGASRIIPAQPQATAAGDEFTPREVLEALERLRNSQTISGSEKLIQFLTFIVETTLNGNATHLKETIIGVSVFGRSPDYDPKADSVVRSQAWRLRSKLNEYYQAEGTEDPLIIDIPLGSYVPVFIRRDPLAGSSEIAAVGFRYTR